MPRQVRRNESPRGYKTNTTTPEIKTEWSSNQHLLDHGYGATPINQVMSEPPNAAPAVKRKLNMETHHFVVPIKQEFKHPPPKRQRRPTPVKKNARYDTSLNVLTKRFSELLGRAPNGVVDLNEASHQLNVQKRRIYDITNVLEGIGILEKKSKNNIQWKGSSENVTLSRRLKQLEDEENQLNKIIETTESQLRNLNNDKYGYVTYQDLQSIGRLKSKTVIAIKAPPKTNLSVPKTADHNKVYSIQIQSKTGEIEVFLCPETSSPVKPKPIPPMDPLLKDIKLSPGLLDIVTPPVPQLDSPMFCRPISSQICRNLSFNIVGGAMGATVTPNVPVQNADYNNSSNNLSCSSLDPLRLSPDEMSGGVGGTAGSKTMPLIHDNGLGPMVGRYSGPQTDHINSGSRDPLFCSEPFVSLEPLLQSEYQFSLDPNEGLSELFDLDFLCH